MKLKMNLNLSALRRMSRNAFLLFLCSMSACSVNECSSMRMKHGIEGQEASKSHSALKIPDTHSDTIAPMKRSNEALNGKEKDHVSHASAGSSQGSMPTKAKSVSVKLVKRKKIQQASRVGLLYEAARTGDIESVKKNLDEGVDPILALGTTYYPLEGHFKNSE